RDGRTARQCRAREPEGRWRGAQAPHGLAAGGPWRRHVAARSPARWRRGEVAGGWPGADAVGQARDGSKDPTQSEDGSLRDRASEEEEEQVTRSIRKGPFVHESLKKKIEQLNARNEKKVVKTWSRASLVLPTMVGHT